MRAAAATAISALLVAACGGGGGGSGGSSSPTSPPTTATPTTPAFTAPAAESLSTADVQRIVAQAAEEAAARNLPAVIAVTDRVGNVLAVFSMNGARATATLRPGTAGNTDFQGVVVPATTAAIAKAITGAYLSSSGNAFSTRTASQIVQQHFPPSANTVGLESGPLFGVQFSQLPCSDVSARLADSATIGPKRSPLGLAADPGGFPLYKNGVVVGGIGIMADGDYGFDPETVDIDNDAEEIIAIAGTTGFDAPATVRADRISADGTLLRYSDATPAALRTTPASARAFAALSALGSLTPVTAYFGGTVLAGQVYGTESSGVRRATTAEFSDSNAFVLSNGAGAGRFPLRAGLDGADVGTALSQAEVTAVLEEAFKVMTRARAQIRQPLDSRAEVSITVADTRGNILGLVRSPDAPIFGIDVSAQKARSAAFFSNRAAAADLGSIPGNWVQRFRTFTGNSTALTGATAFSNRGIGNLARPYFPDGEAGRAPGPLSVPIAQFSPFSNGLQSALVLGDVATHVTFVAGTGADVKRGCTALPDPTTPGGTNNRLRNGLQIFPGAVPIYRGTTLVGAIGVSGDGIDQDDMISGLGLKNASTRVTAIGHAPAASRSDAIVIDLNGRGVRLRYIGCPFAPFVDSSDQNACVGI
jgi:uncharacterized protein GlcG (DUF336 family)